MEINEFFQTANNLMSELVKNDPTILQKPDSSFCMLETESGNIYGGISSVKVVNGKIQPCCAEYNAMMSVIPASDSHIKQIVTMYFSNRNVVLPCQECLYMLFRVDKANKSTNIFISKSEAVNAQGMLLSNTIDQHDPTAAAAAMNVDDAVKLPFEVPEEEQPKDIADFDEAFEPDVPKEPSEAPPIEEFLSSFSPDEDSPFFDSANADKQPLNQAKTIPGAPPLPQSMQMPPNLQQPQSLNGYPQQMPAYNMPPQQMGMYGQQPMGGYPQQMPPQYGMPQQMGMYGQQPMGGYPKQNMQSPNMQPMQPYGMPMNQQPNGYYGTQQQYAANPMPMSRPFVSKQFNSAQVSQNLASLQQNAQNGQSVFKQRLTDFMKIEGEQPDEKAAAENETIDKNEMLRQQREKKKMAKLDSDYKKRMKK